MMRAKTYPPPPSSPLRRLWRILWRTTAILVLAVGVYLGCVFGLERIRVEAEETSDTPSVPIFLLSNGMHTDIVVPTAGWGQDWQTWAPPQDTRSGDSTLSWLAIGWGDKGFYLDTPTWADLKVSTAFRAATALSESAMHCTYYEAMTPGERCVPLLLTQAQYTRLCAYIEGSFDLDDEGRSIVIPTEARYGDNDAFYEAVGSYSLFKSCNTWANRALQVAGQPHALWTVREGGILRHYRPESEG